MHVQIPLMVIRMELSELLTYQLIQTKLIQSITPQKLALNARGRNTFGYEISRKT
jgi:hypothetical protein